jgi:hypothetical protein
MNFNPQLENIHSVISEYKTIVESERANWSGLGHDLPTTLVNGELSCEQIFPVTRTRLETRLTLLRTDVEPGLALTLWFWDKREGEYIDRGHVQLKAVVGRNEYGSMLEWEVIAQRKPPGRLPRDAERLTSRLRAQAKNRQKLDYKGFRKQLVSTVFQFALQGAVCLA